MLIHAIETGGVPSSGNTNGAAGAGQGTLVQQVIHAAYSAFYAAQYLSAFLVLAAGLFTFLILRPGSRTRPASLGSERPSGRAD